MKPDLDRLLRSLRRETPDHPRLPELERLLWQRLANREPPLFWRRFGFHVRATAVLGAFLWGVLIGTRVISVPPPEVQSGEILVETAEFLAPDRALF
jgi:hypothetical protein